MSLVPSLLALAACVFPEVGGGESTPSSPTDATPTTTPSTSTSTSTGTSTPTTATPPVVDPLFTLVVHTIDDYGFVTAWASDPPWGAFRPVLPAALETCIRYEDPFREGSPNYLSPGEVSVRFDDEPAIELEIDNAPLSGWTDGAVVSVTATGSPALPPVPTRELGALPAHPAPTTVAPSGGGLTVTWSAGSHPTWIDVVGLDEMFTCLVEDDGSFDVDPGVVAAAGTLVMVAVTRCEELWIDEPGLDFEFVACAAQGAYL